MKTGSIVPLRKESRRKRSGPVRKWKRHASLAPFLSAVRFLARCNRAVCPAPGAAVLLPDASFQRGTERTVRTFRSGKMPQCAARFVSGPPNRRTASPRRSRVSRQSHAFLQTLTTYRAPSAKQSFRQRRRARQLEVVPFRQRRQPFQRCCESLVRKEPRTLRDERRVLKHRTADTRKNLRCQVAHTQRRRSK